MKYKRKCIITFWQIWHFQKNKPFPRWNEIAGLGAAKIFTTCLLLYTFAFSVFIICCLLGYTNIYSDVKYTAQHTSNPLYDEHEISLKYTSLGLRKNTQTQINYSRLHTVWTWSEPAATAPHLIHCGFGEKQHAYVATKICLKLLSPNIICTNINYFIYLHSLFWHSNTDRLSYFVWVNWNFLFVIKFLSSFASFGRKHFQFSLSPMIVSMFPTYNN